MNALKIVILAALLTLPLPALADDGAADGKAGSIYVQGLGGRMLGDGFGLSLPPVSGDSALLGAGIGSGAVGWQPMESLRVELEYASRAGGNKPAATTAPTGDASLGSRSVMANALFDLRVNDWLTPYVGVGVGVARVDADGATALSLDARSGDAFAYQGIVGLSVPFSDSLSFFADGRFQRTGEFSLATTGSVDHSFQTWSALAGLRFTFGGSK